MGRTRKTGKQALLDKIEKQKEEVVAARKRYDTATSLLKQSMDKLETIEKNEILDAYSKSNRTYDEVMTFLRSGSQADLEDV